MRIGILTAEKGEEDVDENKRLIKEIILSGHRPVIVNYQKTVVAITKKGQRLYQFNKDGDLKLVRLDAVIPRVNEPDEQSINLGVIALQNLIFNGVYTVAEPEAIKLAKSKIGSQTALSSIGLPTPRTAAITSTDKVLPVDEILKLVEPNPNRRLIVKTIVGSFGRGVMPASSRGEARAIVEGFLANNVPVLVQEFIEPKKTGKYNDARLIVVDGKVIAAEKRESTRKDEIRANLSLGGEGSNYKPTAEEISIAQRAALAVGLPIAGVDIIPSAKGPIVIEVNASPGFLIEEITGVNLAKAMVNMVTSNVNKDTLSSKMLKLPKSIKADSKTMLKRLPLKSKRSKSAKKNAAKKSTS